MNQSNIAYILKLNNEINKFVKMQRDVIRTFKEDNKIAKCESVFIDSLLHNLDTLIYRKDIILGLREEKTDE